VSRRGSTYLLVLSVALIVAAVSLSSIMILRVGSRSAASSNDWDEAGVLALAATEYAMNQINTNSNWRTTYTSNVESSSVNLGRGSFTFKLVDTIDGNLTNDPTQPVKLYGIGRVGSTTRVYSLTIEPVGLDFLRTAAHALTSFSLTNGTLTAVNGPISTNGTTYNYSTGVIVGNVETNVMNNGGTIQGNVKSSAPAKEMPQDSVFTTYSAMATTIGYTSTFSPGVLSAAVNPYGTANANGIYKITVPSGGTLAISNSRIAATLLIQGSTSGTATVTVDNVMWDPAQASYPSLIITGGTVNVTFNGGGGLDESSLGVNFNPASTPYNGISNATKTDVFTAELRGLFHITGVNTAVTLGNRLQTYGTIVAGGSNSGTIAFLGPMANLNVNPSYYRYPLPGYLSAYRMAEAPGTWAWDTNQ
jgi:hypothetical protein